MFTEVVALMVVAFMVGVVMEVVALTFVESSVVSITVAVFTEVVAFTVVEYSVGVVTEVVALNVVPSNVATMKGLVAEIVIAPVELLTAIWFAVPASEVTAVVRHPVQVSDNVLPFDNCPPPPSGAAVATVIEAL
jgi:hypothetical protein